MFRIYWISIVSLTLLPQNTIADDAAAALLDQFCNERKIDGGVKIAFNYFTEASGDMECELYQLNELRRVDCRSEAINQTIWFDGEFGWIWKKGQDVERVQPAYLGDSGAFCFDATTIGVTNLFSFEYDLNLLVRRNVHLAKLQPTQNVDGVVCQVVRIAKEFSTIDFFIEEPKLRVHKKLARTDTGSFHQTEETASAFETSAKPLPWLPSTVQMTCSNRSAVTMTDISVVGIATPEDFTIGAIGIPIGTAVIDRDEHFRLGYWTGHDIDEEFDGVVRGEPASKSPIWIYVGMAIMLLAIGAGVYKYSRK